LVPLLTLKYLKRLEVSLRIFTWQAFAFLLLNYLMIDHPTSPILAWFPVLFFFQFVVAENLSFTLLSPKIQFCFILVAIFLNSLLKKSQLRNSGQHWLG
jgi:hypothetical protein